MKTLNNAPMNKTPWNKGKIIGQKPALKLKELWEIRIRLQMAHNIQELALFNTAIDSKLRGCDLVSLRHSDVMHGGKMLKRTVIIQKKTKKPVHFEITEQTRDALLCFALLCFALLCFALLCFALLCFALLCFA